MALPRARVARALAAGAGSLLVALLVAPLAGCVAIYRGAIVQFNLSALADSAPDQHYELFAVINDGVVSLARFKVLGAVSGCGADPATSLPVQRVQRYDEGVDRAGLCAPERSLGAIDRVDLGAASLVGGVRLDTPVDLSEATRLFITLEQDGDSDPRPGETLLGADLAAGRAPHAEVEVACVAAFCARTDPASPAFAARCGDNAPTLPRLRRGVLVGAFLRAPVPEDPCLASRLGEVAVVPATDDSFL